jgi:hypothetical protein
VSLFRLLWNAFGELYAESRAEPKIGGRDSRGYDRPPTFPKWSEPKFWSDK